MNRKIFYKFLKAILISLVTGLFASYLFMKYFEGDDLLIRGLWIGLGILPYSIYAIGLTELTEYNSPKEILIPVFIYWSYSIINIMWSPVIVGYFLTVTFNNQIDSEFNSLLISASVCGFTSLFSFFSMNLFTRFNSIFLVILLSFLIGAVSYILSFLICLKYPGVLNLFNVENDKVFSKALFVFPFWQILMSILLIYFSKKEIKSDEYPI